MSDQRLEHWEERVRQLAGAMPYPPAPDVAAAVRARLSGPTAPSGLPSPRPLRPLRPLRRLAVVAVVIALILAGLMAIPPVRAAVLEFLRIGAIQINLVEPTATPAPTSTPIPAAAAKPTAAPSPTPRPSATPAQSVLDLYGETTLDKAQAAFPAPIRLPTYPDDLGLPDHVFLQDLDGPVVVLVWMDRDEPSRVRLSLHILAPGTFALKGRPTTLRETTVHGNPALWTTGPYMLQFRRGAVGDYDARRLVQGNVLLWTEGRYTYRLETDLSMDEAVKVAESLK